MGEESTKSIAAASAGDTYSAEIESLFLSATTARALPDDHALELGRLFLETSLIDAGMEDLIWRLSGMDPKKTRILTGPRMEASVKRKKLSRVLGQHR